MNLQLTFHELFVALSSVALDENLHVTELQLNKLKLSADTSGAQSDREKNVNPQFKETALIFPG